MARQHWSNYVFALVLGLAGAWILVSTSSALTEMNKELRPMNLSTEFRDNFLIVELAVVFGPGMSIMVLALWTISGKKETPEGLRYKAFKKEAEEGAKIITSTGTQTTIIDRNRAERPSGPRSKIPPVPNGTL